MRMDIEERGELFAKYLGQEVMGAIRSRGFTAAEVAQRIGSHAPTLSHYATGKRPIPQPTLSKVCEVIGISPEVVVARAYERLIEDAGPYSRRSHGFEVISNPYDAAALEGDDPDIDNEQ